MKVAWAGVSIPRMASFVVALALAVLGCALGRTHSTGELTLTLLEKSAAAPGGRCADGTMAGYYLHEGTDPSLFVIYLKGGGACFDEASCTKRAHSKDGSSSHWARTMAGAQAYDSDCTTNPDFCAATHVYVPYCTGDCHAGNNTSPSAASWGLYFDGHANFAAIVTELQRKHRLNAARRVLLTGGSAGGIGTFKNVDYLASRLPHAAVKGAPDAGWFFPAALPGDLPHVFSPSDWAHFSNGQHGNIETNGSNSSASNDFVHGVLWQDRGLYPSACVADQRPEQWWACATVDILYKYIRSPLFVAESQYDTNQIFAQNLAPRNPSSPAQYKMLQAYVVMYGEAMRNSTQQVLRDAPLTKKAQPDGIFHPSCLAHGVSSVVLNGTLYLPILGDWFFERNKLVRYHRLVEHCPAAAAGLPCNTGQHCSLDPTPAPAPGPAPSPGGGCSSALDKACAPWASAAACEACALEDEGGLRAAGCTTQQQVKQLCQEAPSPSPAPQPSGGCQAELDTLCPAAKDPSPVECGNCARAHRMALTKAGCNDATVRQLCEQRNKLATAGL